jgi:hypothetical protein
VPAWNAASSCVTKRRKRRERTRTGMRSQPTRDPAAATRREAATWDDAVQVGMLHEGLSHRVQDGEEPDRGA